MTMDGWMYTWFLLCVVVSGEPYLVRLEKRLSLSVRVCVIKHISFDVYSVYWVQLVQCDKRHMPDVCDRPTTCAIFVRERDDAIISCPFVNHIHVCTYMT